MKIAVTYKDGEVFQHFGHSEQFKIYDVKDGQITGEQIVDTNGKGHGALAHFLLDAEVDAVICGGIGSGAQDALGNAGIALYSGVQGSADEAVKALADGTLEYDTEANCFHHDEGHSCGDGPCGSHAGCAGCHSAPAFRGKNVGKTCRTHYRGTFNDGTQFDSSYDRGEPLEFVCGAGMMIPGYDKAVADMEVGEIKEVHLMPAEAYGESDPGNIITVGLDQLAGAENLNVGQRIFLQNLSGQQIPVTVTAKTDETITLDANHEMAGKELNFTIELVEVK